MIASALANDSSAFPAVDTHRTRDAQSASSAGAIIWWAAHPDEPA